MAATAREPVISPEEGVTPDTLELPTGAEPEVPGEAPLEYDEDELNLVPVFMKHPKGKDALKKISKQVLEQFESGFDASEEYRERFKNDFAIYTGDLPPKSGVFAHSANTHVPSMALNIQRIVARSGSEIFGDWTQPITVAPCGPLPEQVFIANVLTKHSNYQLTELMPDFRRQMERALLLHYVAGDFTIHSYYSEFLRRNIHETLTCDEFVVPYVYTSVMPDWSDCPWRVKILRMYRHELQAYKGMWHDVDKVLEKTAPSWDDEPEQHFREAMGQIEGIEVTEEKGSAPYKLLQYEGWTSELPGQDRDRFVQVVVDTRTRAITSLRLHEEPPKSEEDRYNRQLQELDAWHQALEVHGQQEQLRVQIASHPQMGNVRLHPAMEQQLRNPAPTPPPPDWLEDPNMPHELMEPPPMRKDAIHMYTHGVNMESLAGNLGLGHGRSQADFNRVQNVAMQQFTDMATAHNAPGWLVDENSIETGRPLVLEPLKFHKVKVISGKSLKESLIPLQSPSANPQLAEVVKMFNGFAAEAAQAPEVISGEPGKSGETFRGIQARIEQANRQLSVPTSRFALAYKHVCKLNAKLNSVYLPDSEVVTILNPQTGKVEEVTIERAMYQLDYHVKIKSDLRFVTQSQRVQEADEVLQLPSAMPVLQQNLHFLWHATRKSLEERGRHDMIASLGPEPPPPQTPFGLPPPLPPGAPGQPGAGGPGAPPGSPGPPGPSSPPPKG